MKGGREDPIHYPQEMVEFVHYAEEKLRLLKGEEEKKAAQEYKNFKRIETQAEGLEHSSAFSYEEKGTEI